MTEQELVERNQLLTKLSETEVYVQRLEDNQTQHLTQIERLRAERDAWIAECNSTIARLRIAEAEQNALQAWKDAVPVDAIFRVGCDPIWEEPEVLDSTITELETIDAWLASIKYGGAA